MAGDNNNSAVLDPAERILGAISIVLGRFDGSPHDKLGIEACRQAVAASKVSHGDGRDEQAAHAHIGDCLARALDDARRADEVDQQLLACIESLLPHSGWLKREAGAG